MKVLVGQEAQTLDVEGRNGRNVGDAHLDAVLHHAGGELLLLL